MLMFAPQAARPSSLYPFFPDGPASVADRPDLPGGSSPMFWDDAAGFVEVGDALYVFVRPVHLILYARGGHWACRAKGLESMACGMGKTRAAARHEWEMNFHATFQRLYAKRPFEMDQTEAGIWQSIVNIIDMNEYQESATMEMREIGQVRYRALSYPCEIRWVDGRRERFALSQVPRELAGYRPGQWFEATVERTFEDKLIRISRCGRIAQVADRVPPEFRDEMAPADLAEADWTWPGAKR